MKDPQHIAKSLPHPENKRSRTWKRRTLVGASGSALGLTGAAYAAYRAAPGFWKNFYKDLNRPILHPSFIPNPAAWPDQGIHAAWIGHATVLLKIEGVTVLADPIFSDHAGLHFGVLSVGVKRLIHPALEPDQFPRIDVILLSHAHMDHLDLPSLRLLQDRRTTIVTARHTTDLLRNLRFKRIFELGWNDAVQVGPVRVQGFEVNHWGARMRVDTYRGYNGYLLESGGRSVVIAGDTAHTHAFRNLRRKRPHDLLVMPIGAYNPWIRYHCTPEQAWQMASDAGFEHLMPVHHQTFPLSREPFLEPIERLLRAAGKAEDAVALRQVGQELHLG